MERQGTALLPVVPPICGLATAAALVRVYPTTLRLWLHAQLLPGTQLSGRYVIAPPALLAPFHRLPPVC